MPFLIKKLGNIYKLKKKDGSYVNKEYKSKTTATNAGLNFMRYRGEKGELKRNKIVVKK